MFTAALTILFLVAAVTVGLIVLCITAKPPQNLGVRDGHLAACPGTPNCVSTQAEDREHWIAPLPVASKATPAIEILVEIVRGMPRTTILEQTNNYLRVEFRSRIFRYCDDVEFYLEPDSNRVHFRSASRCGYSDMGVNRDRMELIRQKFREASQSTATGEPQAMKFQPRDTRQLAGAQSQ